MSEQPWFKFYAADYLLDPDVDQIPREAEALLVRMWCVCHREGSCPADPETLARKTLCSLQYVLQCKPHCDRFFELQDGKLYSRRMQEEKRRSDQARVNANKRYSKQTAVPMAVPPSDSDFDSDSGFTAPPPFFKESVFPSKENARAREAREKPTASRELSEEMVKELADRIALPATRPHIEVLASALKVIKAKHGFTTYSECSQFLESCVKNARSHQDLKLEFKPRFFFEDGDYEPYRPIPPELLAVSPATAPPECIVGRCWGCGRPRLTSSSWSEYCADSCRDAHERATA